jgi:hypothetical protein
MLMPLVFAVRYGNQTEHTRRINRFPYREVVRGADFNITTFGAMIEQLGIPFTILGNCLPQCVGQNHIHLRCPGNLGLMGCIVQIFFPESQKRQNTLAIGVSQAALVIQTTALDIVQYFFLPEIQVLVYGEWPANQKHQTFLYGNLP